MHPPLVAIATVPPRGNQECANEVYRKAISLACPLGKVPSEVRRKGEERGHPIRFSEPTADFKNKAYPAKAEKLSSLLPNMISMAEFIAKGFPMVRVDLFDIKGKIVFSEMTFTPGGGLIPFDPLTSDYELGEKLDIKGK